MARRFVWLTLGVAGVAAAALLWWALRPATLPSEVENVLQLRELPPNRWLKYHEERPAGWRRQGHAGMAFDSRRGSLLIFGSDTHGEDWDNAVHEFQPAHKRWLSHQAAAAPDTYRVDAQGRPVAGGDAPQPWAMHTYDAIEYDPRLDALVVASTTEHNPRATAAAGVRRQPTWIYEIGSRRWRMLPDDGRPAPSLFGAASAYDERRGVLIGYRSAIWELDSATGTWHRAADGRHQMHHTMVFAGRRGEAYVFGDYRPTRVVWSYRPAAVVGQPGSWARHEPDGDACPPYSSVPVAYDEEEDVFVLVVDTPEAASGTARTASTCLYDPAANRYVRLPDQDIPAVGMNYMMVRDRINKVVFLVTGDARGTVTVWAMRPRRP